MSIISQSWPWAQTGRCLPVPRCGDCACLGTDLTKTSSALPSDANNGSLIVFKAGPLSGGMPLVLLLFALKWVVGGWTNSKSGSHCG